MKSAVSFLQVEHPESDSEDIDDHQHTTFIWKKEDTNNIQLEDVIDYSNLK